MEKLRWIVRSQAETSWRSERPQDPLRTEYEAIEAREMQGFMKETSCLQRQEVHELE